MAERRPRSSPTTSPWTCLRLDGQGERPRLVLDLSISPNAKRTEVVGWHDGALRLRVAAPPVEGAANDAIRRWLATTLALPQADVELLRGTTGRRKQWALNTPDLARISGWISDMVASGQIPAPTS